MAEPVKLSKMSLVCYYCAIHGPGVIVPSYFSIIERYIIIIS